MRPYHSRRTFCRPVHLLPVMALLLTMLTPLAAQNTGADEEVKPSVFLGLYGGASLNSYRVDISSDYFGPDRGKPTNGRFTEGSGLGLAVGALVELPISDVFGLGLRAGLQDRGAEMTTRYTRTDLRLTDGASDASGEVEGTVDGSLNYLAITPHFRIVPRSLPIYFFLGPTVLMPMGGRYTYNERIVSGGSATFTGVPGAVERELVPDGELADHAFALGANLGLGLEFFLSPTFALIADAQYAPMFGGVAGDLLPDESWGADALTLTAGFKFGFGDRRSAPPPPPPPVEDDTLIAADTTDRVRAGALTDGGLSDTLVARGQTVQQTEVHAFLPYVFFEPDSAIIPARYAMVDRRNTRDFREERIPRGTTLNVYYQLLNIIGSRMRDERRSTITIVGCVGQFENGDTALSRRRAEAVRDYLRDVWRVRENRIDIVAQLLPDNPSSSEVDTLLGDRENMRVEIRSDDLSLLRPVRLPDTLLLQPAGVIRLFSPPPDQPDSVAQLESWQVNITVGDSTIERAAAGYGRPPENIDLALETRPDLERRGPVEITSELVIIDSLYTERRAYQSNSIYFVEEGDFQVARNVENGKYVDRYNLLLYSFDSAGIFDFSQQAASILRDRIMPESKVTILGHTDKIGLPSYNQNLSKRRAEIAAQVIDIQGAEIRGLGEKELLYDNDVPEGRYLSRTVTVIIETPVSAMPAQPSGTSDAVRVPDSPPPALEEVLEGGTTQPEQEEPAVETPSPVRRERRRDVPTSRSLPSGDD